MIEIGSLVRYKNYEEIAIVIEHWIDDNNGRACPVVKWLSGYFFGRRTAEYNEDLEVIA
tara:strand:+ start:331 stop:507 length:177 start_codon:yes stop_codon:yes gene_type:complete